MRIFDFSSAEAYNDLAAVHGSIMAIGNFDGIHNGHRQLLAQLVSMARQENRPATVMTFEPHPRQFFQPTQTPFRLSLWDVKMGLLAATGIDAVFVLPFTAALAACSKEDFMRDILQDRIKPARIIVGNNFHFGHKRSGSAADLQASGFDTIIVQPYCDEQGIAYSSSRVRALIQENKFDDANQVLGWSWYLQGIVQKGDQRGREMGFPTANIPLGDAFHLPYGVYATLVQIADNNDQQWYKAATNIGIRPMFQTNHALIEAHLLDFTADLYGKTLRVRPVAKIRDEQKYTSLDALITQIGHDCEQVRHILNEHRLA